MKFNLLLLLFLVINGFLWGQTDSEIRQIRYSAANDELVYISEMAPFYHGVASGDPTHNSVILWTRITPTHKAAQLNVIFEVATDISFSNIISRGSLNTNAEKDFTVKFDQQGLQPNSFYYYRFIHNTDTSIVGRTKTMPIDDAENIRFGVVSCSNFQAGHFNAYRFASQRTDLDFILHLGDYIYEYGEGGYGYNEDTQRGHEPDHEMVTLEDYRLRHSFYHLDPDLRRAHQLFPWITTWDDHESTNDSYKDGAQNHTDSTEGDWEIRKNAAAKAYSEWMPIRNPDPINPVKIWRAFDYGNLMDLIMIDTRIWGRDKQVRSTNDENYGDPERTILGKDQLSWFKDRLSRSNSQWKIIGNQVQIMLVQTGPNQPFNLDPWDGYPAERDTVLRFIRDNEIDNVVFLTGDIHTTWAADLALDPFNTKSSLNPDGYTALTQDGAIATEFVTPSVTSDNLNEILGAPAGSSTGLEAALMQTNPQIKYIELDDHGLMIFDVNKDRAQAQWYVGEILERDTTPELLTAYKTDSESNRISPALLELFEDDEKTPENPEEIKKKYRTDIGTKEIGVVFNAFPNPCNDFVRIQFGIEKAIKGEIYLIDAQGKTIIKEALKSFNSGVYEYTLNTSQLKSGIYFFQLKSRIGNLSYQIVKS
ncbi:alkaline phosphatase D family protein [Luteibaculum oceani]|uniref:T9SS type A sorting domain-containing protein n=1 Tax=Luteibaculum oceani TaxID=1294296 RepID=A0A5C6UT75_9FLAO|nr:alkaline phosphatase D family protein [Luteibaculum oceani]TXC76169.1 T9SS type A sorting domain-containing protein [Luteibaculum oceani]